MRWATITRSTPFSVCTDAAINAPAERVTRTLIENLPHLAHGDRGHCRADPETLASLLRRHVLLADRVQSRETSLIASIATSAKVDAGFVSSDNAETVALAVARNRPSIGPAIPARQQWRSTRMRS